MRHQANSNWQMAIGKSQTKILRQFLASTLRTARAIFREIFDESAYDRFLARTASARSVASYRAFTRERESSLARKPRCC